MKLLVIGGTGRILGHAIVRRALDAGHEVLVYHRGQHHSARDPDVPHLHGSTLEIADRAHDIRRFGPEAVIDTTQARTDTVASVIAGIKGLARRYVLVSSGDVYRGYGVLHGTEDGPAQVMPVNEDAALRTRPSFDQTETEDKLFAERAALGQHDVPATVVRAPAIVGVGDPVKRIEQRVTALRESGGHLALSEKRAAWRFCYGYVDDVSDALLLCAEDRRPQHRVYNVAYPDGISNLEMLTMVAKVIGWAGRIEVVKGEGADDAKFNQELYVDSSRIREELGYAERVLFEDAVRLYVETMGGFTP